MASSFHATLGMNFGGLDFTIPSMTCSGHLDEPFQDKFLLQSSGTCFQVRQ